MRTEPGPLHIRMGPLGMTAKVHSTVLLTICDSYIRRPDGAKRVIGTLLGTATEDAIIIKECYAVPHEEDDEQVKLDVVHHKTMLDLHQQVHPKDTVVGWFATGLERPGSDALIQDFYGLRQQSGCSIRTPVHLVVDTTLSVNDRLSIKSYISRKLILKDTPLAAEFVEIPTQVMTTLAETMGLDILKKEKLDSIPKDTEHFKQSFKKLHELINQAHDYVSDVLEGKREADVAIGRYLADVIGAVPINTKQEFKQLFDSSVQDILLVLYLSNLVRSHVALAEKLSTFALPLL